MKCERCGNQIDLSVGFVEREEIDGVRVLCPGCNECVSEGDDAE
jgi:formate dehydrogenase maturation protein FdhE